MPARLDGEQILIEASGVSKLRLKAELTARMGGAEPSNVECGLLIPSNVLSAVASTLVRIGVDAALRARIDLDTAHEEARGVALEALDDPTPSVNGGWDQQLDQHQRSAVNAIVTRGLAGVCLYDEQGSGKTVMAIAAFDILRARGDVDKLIVLCPKTMISEWRKDFAKFTGSRHRLAALTDAPSSHLQQGFEECDVYVSNYEGLGRIGVRLSAVAGSARTLLVIDESFFLKNASAQRTRLAARLRSSCMMGLVLCGTPAPNSYGDIVAQFDLADNGFTFGGYRADGLADVRERIATRGVMIRRLKADIMPELADKRLVPVVVSLSPRQAYLYRKARDELALHLRTLDNQAVLRATDSYFQKRETLLQICAWPENIDPTYAETSGKVVALDQLMERLVEREKRKVVLWSSYASPIAALAKRYARFNPVVISGDTAQADSSAAVTAFQTDASVRCFIGNPRAAGAGITLTAAADAIYFSLSNRASDFLQSLDRIHRRGQVASEVTVYVLLAEGTLENAEYARLLAKEQAQRELLRDDERTPITVGDALEELERFSATAPSDDE